MPQLCRWFSRSSRIFYRHGALKKSIHIGIINFSDGHCRYLLEGGLNNSDTEFDATYMCRSACRKSFRQRSPTASNFFSHLWVIVNIRKKRKMSSEILLVILGRYSSEVVFTLQMLFKGQAATEANQLALCRTLLGKKVNTMYRLNLRWAFRLPRYFYLLIICSTWDFCSYSAYHRKVHIACTTGMFGIAPIVIRSWGIVLCLTLDLLYRRLSLIR